ncbi:MAG TPA: acyltransferase family protein [Candidatus Woesebacteria bacterium]|nr:acyltransferase family protein [Candidatus Woesebacteria bacterium]
MQLSKTEKQIELELIRAIAVACVVYIHTASLIVNNLPKVSEFSWFSLAFIDALVRWCVPVFIMVSGSLLLQKSEPHLQFVKKRLSRIGLPLLIWLPLYWLTVALFNPPLPNLRVLLQSVVYEQPYLHFYFLFVMLQLAILTPWLRSVVRSLSHRSLALMIILLIYIGMAYQSKTTNLFYLFIPYLGYYLYGYFARNFTFKRRLKLIAVSMIVSVSSLMVIAQYFMQRGDLVIRGVANSTTVVSYLSPLVVVLSLLAFPVLKDPTVYRWFAKLINQRAIVSIGECSFGIYLIHPILGQVLVYFLPKLHDVQLAHAIPVTLVLTMCLFFVSWAIAWAIRRLKVVSWLV